MCDCINPFAWLLESIAEGVTLDELKERGLVGEGVTLEELLPRCMCVSSVPAQRDTDTALSERAQVVDEAVREDELHDFLLNVVEIADMFGVPIIWENMPPTLTENDEDEDGEWDDEDEPMPPQPIPHAGRRAAYKSWRRFYMKHYSTRLYIPRYALAHNIATFEGEVYRLIHPGDFSYSDIPF